MVEKGDDAPDFTAPAAKPNGDIEAVSLSETLADGPTVLAFFPGAFTSVCTGEMVTFRDRLDELEAAGADLYGVSIDSPFSLQEFADQHDLNFPLVGDTEKELLDAYDVRMDFEALDIEGVAERAVFVVDEDGTVTYAWVGDDPGVEPDYDEVVEAAADA
ncbi:redoxin domain-containing protein [Natronomonas marina]|jgi:peroxiredoxin|uniref:redoxin domain-containing protein n=1 Tax=Natronomonas marina TaxID=2961939 RepID=UPI0020C9EAB2|nr:redoxin domain-containing protein [Natronomonas marina]